MGPIAVLLSAVIGSITFFFKKKKLRNYLLQCFLSAIIGEGAIIGEVYSLTNAALGWLWPRFLNVGIGHLFKKLKNYLVEPIATLLERDNRPYPKKRS